MATTQRRLIVIRPNPEHNAPGEVVEFGPYNRSGEAAGYHATDVPGQHYCTADRAGAGGGAGQAPTAVVVPGLGGTREEV
jgi:hypothetical protein